MKTILYATDCSAHSASTLQYVHYLGKQLHLDVIVLHVFDIPSFPGTTMIRSMREMEKNAYQEQKSVLNAYCEKHLGKDLGKLNIKTDVIYNASITEGILKKATELSADLLIIGTKDEHNQRGFLAGDIAKKLLTIIPIPLLVVPKDTFPKQIDTVVYATDFEEDDIWAIDQLTQLIKPFGSKIYILHISKSQVEDEHHMSWFKEMVQQTISYEHMEFINEVSNNIYEKLTTSLKDKKADLVVLLERKDRSLFKKVFHKDLVKHVESHTVIPLLSFNARN